MDTSKTMYQIGIKYINPEITEIKVVSETAKYVMVEIQPGIARRKKKKTQWDEIHPTWQEAHARLLNLLSDHVFHAENSLHASKEMLREVEAMKCPK